MRDDNSEWKQQQEEQQQYETAMSDEEFFKLLGSVDEVKDWIKEENKNVSA